MKKFALLAVLVSCTSQAELSETGQESGGLCPDWGCGVNSPAIDDGFFHELNMDGVRNLEGYAMNGGMKYSSIYDVTVENAKMIARFRFGLATAPRTLTGNNLIGLEISLSRVNPSTGTSSHYTLVVDDVDNFVEYRAQAPNITSPTIETYELSVRIDSGLSAKLCQHGAEWWEGVGPGPARMPEYSALVFEGERINASRKTISAFTSSRWFNLGCAESALAKMHLYGHTQASQSVGFSTTIAERQTMLKMLVADYCGTGKPFTVAGQMVEWEDDHGTMTIPSNVTKVLEARWRSTGPACLNTPRVAAHPSAASDAAFPHGIEAAIAAECTRPPTCPSITTSYHLRSYNLTPFTN